MFEFFAIIVQSCSGEGVIPILAGIGDEECDSGSIIRLGHFIIK